MSFPSDYVNEIQTLDQEVLRSQPSDILQFCANYFNRRLETERAKQFSVSPFSSVGFSMSNPFAGMYSNSEFAFPGTLSSSGLGLGLNPLDGTIREEDDEDIHSPTTPNFRPTFGLSGSGSGPGRSSPSGTSPSHQQTRRNVRSDQLHGARTAPRTPAGSHLSPNTAQGEFPSNYNTNRRVSVSAESLQPTNESDDWTPPVHPKTQDQLARLKVAVSGNFLFSHLEEEQFSQVLSALVEKPIPAKDTRVITQGDVGDFFYIVERGLFDIYVNSAGRMLTGSDGMGNKVGTIEAGGSFGELALMYNAPRAATIISTTAQNVLWALDRVTFRRILMENTFKRRRMYEQFLEDVPILNSLVRYERSKIADALDTATFEEGSTIIREGDAGDKFYFVEQGIAEVYKENIDGPIGALQKGDYFGELALINDAPRAASIIAKSKVKVAYLGKDGFQRLLGPVLEIMRRNDPTLRTNSEALASLKPPNSIDGQTDVVEEAAGRGQAVEV